MQQNQILESLIRDLSIKDKKSLTQKALKLSEETGELAKQILPFENAFATNHRFVSREKILEELADVYLCNISMVYSMFSDEEFWEMVLRKALKWQDLQTRELNLGELLPYEIHITVRTNDIEKFKNTSHQLNVKPIILDIQNNKSENLYTEVMTSSVFMGNNRTAYEEMKRISTFLKESNFEVVREKIETVPWHPSAPSEKHQSPLMPINCYFETHLNVITSLAKQPLLAKIAKQHSAHLSRNIFKKIDNEFFTIMLTKRSYQGTREIFEKQSNDLNESLLEAGFQTSKKIVEFSLFDTKVSHDAGWIFGSK